MAAKNKIKEKNNPSKKRKFRDFTNAHVFEIATSFDSTGDNIITAISKHAVLKKIWEKNVIFMNALNKRYPQQDTDTENQKLIQSRKSITQQMRDQYFMSLPDYWNEAYPADE